MEADTRMIGQPDKSLATSDAALGRFPISSFGRSDVARYARSFLVMAAASVCLSACATRFEPENLEIISQITEVPRSRAMIIPGPGRFGLVTVLERRYSNAYSQELLLETSARRPGQNNIRVAFVLPGSTTGPGEDELDLMRLSPETVSRDMSEQFPGVNMSISAFFVQNRFGPFGFATGRSAYGDNCVYAWQIIAPDRPLSLFSAPKGKINIRLQICDSAATTAEILDVMYNFTINAYLSQWNWMPLEDTPPLNPQFGEPGAEVRPVPLAPPEVLVVPAPAAVSASSGRRVRPETVIGSDDIFEYSTAPTRSSRSGTARDRDTDPVAIGNYPIVPPPP